ncbi:MAG: Zn-dependent oligopeptidase [Elusimicrobium sp.]|jgi:thimet oligopeptidase|nr:Zn-dependent oligopeptidase [Elusimicrobium sp.]
MKKILISAAVLLPLLSYGSVMDTMFENNALRFDYQPAEIAATENLAAMRFEGNIKKILAVPPAQRNFDNTVLAFERAFNDYWYTAKALSLMAYFHDDAQVREEAAKLESKGSQFKAAVLARKDIYKAIKEYSDTRPVLSDTQVKLMRFWLNSFERAGAKLEGAAAGQYNELTKSKMEDITKFNVNLMQDSRTLEVAAEQLKGMSGVYINRLDKTPDGKYIVTLKYPDYNPFMANAQDEDARKELQIKFANRGGQENVALLESVLQDRSKTARLLGFKDHPQFVLADRMAKNDTTLVKFLKDIENKLKPIGKKELADYKKLKSEMTGKPAEDFTLWDYPYYYNQYMKKYYNVDQEKLKEYFPAEQVINGMFDVFGNLFGLTFERADLPVWQKDVLAYKIKDKETGEEISNFYLDLYPRDGKYTHDATWSFIDAYKKPDGSYQPPSVVIAANLTPAGNGVPSLLDFNDVTTLFHEFGHVLQMSLTRPEYASLGGDNMAWDYIETHSQLLENWAWQPAVLKKISRHYKTGEQLPDDMINSLIKSRRAGNALPMLRQNFLAQLDYRYHKSNNPVDTTAVYDKLSKEIYMLPMTPGTHPQGNFQHIMSLTDPYDVGYYVYAWSLVIADDIFAQFEKYGIDNADVGAELRRDIYTPGMTRDPNEMVEKFLGRPYNNKAFLQNFGVKTK